MTLQYGLLDGQWARTNPLLSGRVGCLCGTAQTTWLIKATPTVLAAIYLAVTVISRN